MPRRLESAEFSIPIMLRFMVLEEGHRCPPQQILSLDCPRWPGIRFPHKDGSANVCFRPIPAIGGGSAFDPLRTFHQCETIAE
jgi:hypothetical protein